MPIEIMETKRCDTRSIEKTFTKEDVIHDTIYHNLAVRECTKFICQKIQFQSTKHDYTKLNEYLPMFYNALKSGLTGDDFRKLEWFQIHCHKERHHLNDFCPNDVNLIDVIEMICDCVCAGKARSGIVYPISISNEILQKAVKNTEKMLEDNIVVVKEETK